MRLSSELSSNRYEIVDRARFPHTSAPGGIRTPNQPGLIAGSTTVRSGPYGLQVLQVGVHVVPRGCAQVRGVVAVTVAVTEGPQPDSRTGGTAPSERR